MWHVYLTEHPYEKRLTKSDWNYVRQFEDKYNGEAINMGMFDKMEVEAVRQFLWKAGELSLIPVSFQTILTQLVYSVLTAH